MNKRDAIGKRGEALVIERLMDPCGRDLPYFDPHFLGEKCPTFDYLVQLETQSHVVPYFLAQVKTTRDGITSRSKRLNVEVKQDHVRKMVRCPFPTYILGVDEIGKMVYVASIHGNLDGGIRSMPTTYPLDAANLQRLWNEVDAYWRTLDASKKTSAFVL